MNVRFEIRQRGCCVGEVDEWIGELDGGGRMECAGMWAREQWERLSCSGGRIVCATCLVGDKKK